jgi:hypothetical protein
VKNIHIAHLKLDNRLITNITKKWYYFIKGKNFNIIEKGVCTLLDEIIAERIRQLPPENCTIVKSSTPIIYK